MKTVARPARCQSAQIQQTGRPAPRNQTVARAGQSALDAGRADQARPAPAKIGQERPGQRMSVLADPASAARARHILCMKWGTKSGPEYVNRLYAMVRRHLRGEFGFVCLTDDGAGIRSEVQC